VSARNCRHIVIPVLAAAALLAAMPASARPDWNRLDDPLEGGIGVHAGWIGGTGLAFKWPLQWWLQLQAAGGIWNTEDHRRHNAGVELQYLLRQDPRLRLFLVAGLGYYNHRERERQGDGTESWRTQRNWNSGFGVGVERLMGERWALKVDLDFTYRDKNDSVTLWPQAGLFFYW
jgi:hypothetical protein